MSIRLGKFNQLEVVKEVDFGMYLDGGEEGEILLPARYVPQDCKPGDMLNVFLYLDNEERLVATTLTPLAQVGDFAALQVNWTNEYGAFLDWGLMKDLFVPFREQKDKMQKGNRYVVHVHLDDNSYRIMGSAKVEHYLSDETPAYNPGDRVNVLVYQRTDLGYKAIVDGKYGGLIYASQVFTPIQVGDTLEAYIQQVRPDGKIDLELQRSGPRKVDDFAQTLLDYIHQHGNRIAITDKSDPEEIYNTFGVSKKTFKKAVGDLYKKRLIVLDPDSIRAVK